MYRIERAGDFKKKEGKVSHELFFVASDDASHSSADELRHSSGSESNFARGQLWLSIPGFLLHVWLHM